MPADGVDEEGEDGVDGGGEEDGGDDWMIIISYAFAADGLGCPFNGMDCEGLYTGGGRQDLPIMKYCTTKLITL